MVFGVGVGAVAATIGGKMLQGAVAKQFPQAGDPKWKPLFSIATGALGAGLLQMAKQKDMASYVLVGGGVAAVIDLLNTYVVPKLPLAGYGDYVQLPYAGYNDYVQLPYQGYGSPAQVAAGEFGTAAMVEAGEFGHADGGTFVGSF